MKKLPCTNKKLLLENIDKHTGLSHMEIAEMLGKNRYSLNYRVDKHIPVTEEEMKIVLSKFEKKHCKAIKFIAEAMNEFL